MRWYARKRRHPGRQRRSRGSRHSRRSSRAAILPRTSPRRRSRPGWQGSPLLGRVASVFGNQASSRAGSACRDRISAARCRSCARRRRWVSHRWIRSFSAMEERPACHPRSFLRHGLRRHCLQLMKLVLQLGRVLLGCPQLGSGSLQLRGQAFDGCAGCSHGRRRRWGIAGRGRGGWIFRGKHCAEKGAQDRLDPTWDAGPLCAIVRYSTVSFRGSLSPSMPGAFYVLSLSHP